MTTVDSPIDTEVAVYVYAIVDAEAPIDQVVGLDSAVIELVEFDDIAAATAWVAVERPPGRRHDLVAHSHVLDTLLDRGPVVPVQFGSFMRDRDAVVDELLRPRAADWRGLLAALRGRRQFNLRATYHEDAVLEEVVRENPTIARLRKRTRDLPEDAGYPDRMRLGELVSQALAAKRDTDTSLVYDAVLPHVVSYAPRQRGGVDHLLDVALLVDDDHREAVEGVLEDLAEAMHERARMDLMGPVPPYDFVEGDWWV